MLTLETQIMDATSENVKKCAEMIKEGEIVAFPTETVYGLGANALDERAARKIFEAKGRPATNPLICHVSDVAQIDMVAVTNEKARLLIDALMPGALTLVLPKKPSVPDVVTAGGNTVGVRMPDHPVALALIREAGCPVCAPSANTSSRPSPTRAEHVFDDLKGRIPVVLDGGKCPLGLESTVLDLTCEPPKVLRAGSVSIDEIERIIGEIDKSSVMVDVLSELKAPTRYVHKTEFAFSAYYDGMQSVIADEYDKQISLGKNPVIFCLDCSFSAYGARHVKSMGKTVEEYATSLFDNVRDAEKEGYDCIIAEGVSLGGIGTTLMSRLMKLSGGKVI